MRRTSHFFTKVVGVTFDNDDGSSRQSLIPRCDLLERLQLDHDEDSPHDPNAVRVLRQSGEQLGHLRRRLAAEVVAKTAKGYRYGVFVKDITGGGRGRNYGMNLLILVAAPGVSDAEAQTYGDELMDRDFLRGQQRADRVRADRLVEPQDSVAPWLWFLTFAVLLLLVALLLLPR
jgi:HIRAN domain